MKRDMELCRVILLEIEKGELFSETIKLPKKQVEYHLRILEEAGLIKRESFDLKFNERVIPYGNYELTWEGHDFIDAARDNSIFRKAIREIQSSGVAITFEILSEYLKMQAKKALGLE